MIYVLHDELAKAVKIGFATNVAKRLASLQVAHSRDLVLLGSMPGDRTTEKRLHRQLADDRIRGEWFLATPDVLDFLRGAVLERGRLRTVAEELARRGNCRYGLRGVRVAIEGFGPTAWEIGRTQWSKAGPPDLRITVWSPDAKPDVPVLLTADEQAQADRGETVVILRPLSELRIRPDPASTMRGLKADQCYLLSEWPSSKGTWLGEISVG